MKGKDITAHIGIFGRRNNGKSSIINALAGQDIAIVSEIPGTTTDPVRKSIELSGVGSVVMIDTAGIDDEGQLGELRINKTLRILKNIDLAILITTENTLGKFEFELIDRFSEYDIPFFIIQNKSDLNPIDKGFKEMVEREYKTDAIGFCALNPTNVNEIVSLISKYLPENAYQSASLVGDLLSYGDIVLLITPIDIEAPEGRLILPQVQVIRDILDNDCVAIVLKEREVDAFLRKTAIKPKLAVTDSQAFLKADASIPKEIPLTSFSILLARLKGDFENYLKGTPKISQLKNGDKVLILESCTHQVSCDDIGRVKIPRWLSNFSGKKLEYTVISGLDDIPSNIQDYALVIQCGGCMITRKQLLNRLKPAIKASVPVTNYGMAIAYVHGIYERAIQPFVKTSFTSEDYL